MIENIENKAVLYRFGRFEINAKEGLLRREGEIVPLTPKIFETLLLLVKNNGRMLTKDEIMETVWADSFVEETNLTSNISRLRKILDADGDGQYIETFSKRGYRFRAEVEESRGDSEIIVTRRTVTRIRQTIEETDETEIAPEYADFLASVPNNLHAPPNALVGREKEIAEICSLLRQNRLVTLTGIGGTGKTRLAQEIALRMLPEFADGVFFVALEAVRNAELIASEFAQLPGVKQASGKSLLERLKNFLQTKQMLIAADNFEQIISAAPFLTELLKAAPNLRILVTSRVRLHLKSEREFIVPPLALPSANRQRSFAELSNYEAVKLFERRADGKTEFFADRTKRGNDCGNLPQTRRSAFGD
ncbi:MAG: helix-turn-helix transcriptional regulator [Acidobacteriota bacterium]|nr:helix-turn-helix transcriptional regulator [Acidobacteriota bacterium]